MSKQALFYYAENLHLVQKATFTTPTGKEYGLGENGRDLLVFLCNGANEKQGYLFHFGFQYIAEETGIHINTVKRLFAGLEQLGWITRTGVVVRHMGRGAPTVEYELTFYTRSIAQNMRTGSQTSSHMATDNLAKGKPSKEAVTELGLETEPKPKPEPKTQVTSDLVGQEWGQEHDRLLADCITTEQKRNPYIDRGGLTKALIKHYRPIVARAMKERPTTDLVGWCYQVRNGEAPAPATTVKSTQGDKYDPTCTTCDKGLVIVRDKTYPGSFDTEWCACTERTTLRLVNE
jgi:DNA-binding HxlR family transcriptional regulator